MSNINKYIATGRAGSDPELKYTPKQMAVVEMGFAIDSGWGDNKKTNWINFVFFGKSAEAVAKFVKKGDKLALEGRLDHSTWDAPGGEKRHAIKCIVSEWDFAGSSKDSQSQQLPEQQGSQSFSEGQGDDIPF